MLSCCITMYYHTNHLYAKRKICHRPSNCYGYIVCYITFCLGAIAPTVQHILSDDAESMAATTSTAVESPSAGKRKIANNSWL